MTHRYEPTAEQSKVIEAYVNDSLVPLLGKVLTKQLGMAALFMRDELKKGKPALQRIAELLEDGEGPDLEDLLTDDTKRPRLSAEERAQLAVIVRWARLPVDGVRAGVLMPPVLFCSVCTPTDAGHAPGCTFGVRGTYKDVTEGGQE